MSKYRIIKQDVYYTAQRKVLGLFWRDLSIDNWGGSCTRWYNMEAAMGLINEHKKEQGNKALEIVWEG